MMEVRTRQEHVQWCKERALAYLPDDPAQAVASMLSDMGKHEETRHVLNGPLATIGLIEARDAIPESVQRFIEGFN
jgi:hypothetical protein